MVSRLIRRLHLYAGLLLLPWVVMFGVSSFVFNHPAWFAGTGPNASAVVWETLADRPYDIEVVPGVDLRVIAARMIGDLGLSSDAGYGVYRNNPDRINVTLPNFRHPVRITYFISEHRALVERRPFVSGQFLTGLHTRGGYHLGSGRQTAWAVTIDLVSGLLLFWIASGLYMWWGLPASRSWGWLALAAGLVAFAGVMFTL